MVSTLGFGSVVFLADEKLLNGRQKFLPICLVLNSKQMLYCAKQFWSVAWQGAQRFLCSATPNLVIRS